MHQRRILLGWLIGSAAAALSVSPSARAQSPVGVTSLVGSDVQILGEISGQGAGFRVGPAGDLDGDGIDDVVVGAWADSTAGPSAGAVYVVYGPVGAGIVGLGAADAKLVGERTGDFAGEGWAGVGDLDRDGYDDLLIGAPGRDPAVGQPGTAAPGAAYLYYGRERRLRGTLSLAGADVTLTGESHVDFAGLAAATAADLNRDGFDDLVVGAPRDDAAGPEAGAVYVFHGGKRRLPRRTSLARADAKLVGAPGDLAGFRLERAGDLDGDRRDDLVIGAPAIPPFGGTGVGAAYVLYASARRLSGVVSLPANAARLVGEVPDDRPGIGIGEGGDLDRDGYDDLVVGADREDSAGPNAGAAYLFYGSRRRLVGTMSLSSADAKLTGEAAGDRAGYSVAITPGLRGRRRADLLVGAFGHDAAGDAAGAAYVLHGRRRRLTGTISLVTADAKLLGVAAGDLAGGSVAAAGDVNADGGEDLTIGADGSDAGQPDAGAVYIEYGRPGRCLRRVCRDPR